MTETGNGRLPPGPDTPFSEPITRSWKVGPLRRSWSNAQTGDRLFLGWLGVAAVALVLVLVVAYSPIYLYFFVWTLGVGVPLFVYRDRVREFLTRLPGHPLLRFMALGALMVLSEETVAALVNTMKEGFTPGLWAERIPQFWLFNLMVFLPLFLGWYLVSRRFGYSMHEAIYLAGAVGVYSEHILPYWITDPHVAAIFTPVEIATYAVIALPPFLSVPWPAPAVRPLPTWARYVTLPVIPILLAGVGAFGAETLRVFVPVRRAATATDNGRSHARSRSGRQGVAGNGESGGPTPQARRPKEDEPTRHPRGRATLLGQGEAMRGERRGRV